MSENTTETTEATETTETTDATTDTVDLAAEAEKWKALSRKHEQQAKANAAAAKELDDLRRASLTDAEKLVEQTREETRRAVQLEYATKLVDAELKAALNGKSLQGDAILGFDKTKFVNADGEVDSAAIMAWVEAHTKPADATSAPNLGQGSRGSKTAPQTSSEKFAEWAKDIL